MASPPWKELPGQIPPTIGPAVWVCQLKGFTKPFLASWSLTNQGWNHATLNKLLPWYICPWWRAQ